MNHATRTPADDAQDFESDYDTIFTLPAGMSVDDIANSCRETALMFLTESAPWGKAELALWLMGPYGQATRHGCNGQRFQSGARPVPMLRDIDARFVDRFISAAHEEIVQTVRGLVDSGLAAEFAERMIGSEFVTRCEDRGHEPGWVPTNVPMRLADRVLSLIAADFLTRPMQFDPSVYIGDDGQGTYGIGSVASFSSDHGGNDGAFDGHARGLGAGEPRESGFQEVRSINTSILPKGA